MEQFIRLTTPLDEEMVKSLKAGDQVLFSGIIYTARDAAHKRMTESYRRGEDLPIDVRGQVIYYAGPCPAKPGRVIGSAGPTTSGRVDAYTPLLLSQGLKGMIGKGFRSPEVIQAMKEHGAVYFAATGGAGALLASKIKAARVVAYDDLGTEAIAELVVEDFPAIVVIDAAGTDLYATAPDKYRDNG